MTGRPYRYAMGFFLGKPPLVPMGPNPGLVRPPRRRRRARLRRSGGGDRLRLCAQLHVRRCGIGRALHRTGGVRCSRMMPSPQHAHRWRRASISRRVRAWSAQRLCLVCRGAAQRGASRLVRRSLRDGPARPADARDAGPDRRADSASCRARRSRCSTPIAGIPLGRLADVGRRRVLIACGMAVWSVATAACAFADSFWSLFGARLLVGVGEAALVPAAMSLLAGLFRSRASRPRDLACSPRAPRIGQDHRPDRRRGAARPVRAARAEDRFARVAAVAGRVPVRRAARAAARAVHLDDRRAQPAGPHGCGRYKAARRARLYRTPCRTLRVAHHRRLLGNPARAGFRRLVAGLFYAGARVFGGRCRVSRRFHHAGHRPRWRAFGRLGRRSPGPGRRPRSGADRDPCRPGPGAADGRSPLCNCRTASRH